MIDVNSALLKVSSILKTDGILILDLPDYFVEAGKHHWKYIEHLWMFRKEDLERILNNLKFTMLDISSPIPGKLVFVAKKVS
jgi:hypothetical protein